MEDADDPDPGDWPVHPALALYGLWPRFAVRGDGEAEDSPEAPGAPE